MRWRASSRFATAMTLCPQANDVMEWESTFVFSVKKDGKRKKSSLAHAADFQRVVAFDPGVKTAVADFVAFDANFPDSLRYASKVIGIEVGGHVNGDIVSAVGGMVELVVNGEPYAVGQPHILNELTRLDFDPLVAVRRFDRDDETILRIRARFRVRSRTSIRVPSPTTADSSSTSRPREATRPVV